MSSSFSLVASTLNSARWLRKYSRRALSPTPLLIVDRTTFSTNHGKYGGAIYSNAIAGPVTIRESVLTSNSAELDGGAIWATGNYGIDIIKTTINSNTATRNGGGLQSSGRAWIATSTISKQRGFDR